MKFKFLLLLQSLLPLIIIVLLINVYNLVVYDYEIKNYYFYFKMIFIIILILVTVVAIISFLVIKRIIYEGEELPQTIVEISKSNKISLEFFMTYLFPMCVCNISNIVELITFSLILIFMSLLIYRTDMYYVNPILIVLGYSLYEIKLFDGNTVQCVSRDKLKEGDRLKFKIITKSLIYGRKMKYEG